MKRKFFAAFLSLCMVMSLVPMTALAAQEDDGAGTPSTQAATELPGAVDGVITLTSNVTISDVLNVRDETANTIDLNGFTLSVTRLDSYTDLTIMDSSTDGRGTLTSEGSITCVVWGGHSISLESGTIQNTNEEGTTIFNLGTFTMNGGVISGDTVVYNTAKNDDDLVEGNIVCNISGGQVEVGTWGIVALGQGLDENGATDNDKVTVNITGGEIGGTGDCQAIATNASGGAYAGFTINISGGAIDGGDDGCGMYLPGIGVTNISGGTVRGAQAIRIAAGELYVTGGTVEGTATLTENTDLINGGSGGTEGAIVVGKAGNSGYVGNVIVNVSQNAVIQNLVDGSAAVVVSDKNMSNENYQDLSIDVSIEGVNVTGDVVKVSNLSDTGTSDGGNTSLTIQNTTIEGDVTNQSKTGVTILDSTVNGTVRASSGHTLVLGDSTVETTDNSGGGSLYVENSESPDNNVVAVNNRTATTYDNLAQALTAAQDGDTITLMKDIENLDDSSITQPSGVYTITKAITLNGNGHSISVSADFGDANIINVENSGTVTIKDLTVNGNSNSRHCINIFSATATDTPSEVTLENVVTTGGKTGVTIGGSTVTINGADTNIAMGAWSAVNVDSTSSSTRNASLTVVEGTIGAIFLENTAASQNVSTTVRGGNIASITTADDNTSATVTGGTFKESVAEYVDSNLLKYESNLNGVYTYYNTLEGALANGGIVQSVETAQVADADKHTLTLMNNGDVTAQIVLASEEPYELPTLPNQGYNRFQGWRSSVNGEVYPGGQEVTITADTTFTAQWSYVPPANPNYKITIGDMENGTVTANPTAAKAGATVTLTPVPDEGYALSTLTVTDRFGDAVRVTEQADGTYTFTMPNGQVTVTATFVQVEEPAPTEPFVDVAEGDWFYDAVVYAYQNELMDGVGGNRFAPNSETTRAQLVTILYRLEGQPAVSGDLPFTDVEAGIWYTDAILWAAQNGIVNGVTDTTFAPGDEITRQQLVTILYRYAEAKGYDVSASADLSGYPDADQVQDYAQPAMAWAVAEGIVEGMDGTLKPAGNASRAQIATILMRFCEDVAQ